MLRKILINRQNDALSAKKITRIMEIQRRCNLSPWTAPDYAAESLRGDSVFLTAENENEEDEAEIIGFLIARISGDAADLHNFGVLEEFQKQGVGAKLFEILIKELFAASARKIWLEVRVSNKDALRFYLKRSFEIIQTRKNFYTDPAEDAYILKYEMNHEILEETFGNAAETKFGE